MAVILAVLVVGGAVVEHHAMPEMPGMGAATTCLAVLGTAVAVAQPIEVSTLQSCGFRRPCRSERAGSMSMRAGPVSLALLVLRR